METTNLGRIGPVPQGDFKTENLPYRKYDMVMHNGDGYISMIEDNNEEPGTGQNWKKIVEKGLPGPKGDTFTFDDLTPEQLEGLKGDVLDYTIMTESEKNDLASRVPITGVVEEGNTQAVSGGEVYEKSLLKKDMSFYDFISYESYIVDNLAIDSNGEEVVQNGARTIKDIPIDPSRESITISNITVEPLKKIVFKNSDNNILIVHPLNAVPKVLPIPEYASKMSFTIKRGSDLIDFEPKINYGNSVIDESIYLINGKKITADSLFSDNHTPAPISDYNAVNKSYFDENAIKISDIELSKPVNLASLGNNVINDYFISGSGVKSVGVGWKMLRVDVSSIDDLSYISFGNFAISSGGWSAFYNEADNVMLQVNSTHNGTGKTVQKPEGAYWLYIDIQRPTGISEYSEIQVNEGEELLPYTDPTPSVTKIKGYTVDSGGSNVVSFEDLNDVPKYIGNGGKSLRINNSENGITVFDAVEQNGTAYLASLNVQSIALNLPTGAGTPPLGVEIGDAWIDTLDEVVKIKLS